MPRMRPNDPNTSEAEIAAAVENPREFYDTGIPSPDGARRPFSGEPEQIAGDIRNFATIGVQELIFAIAAASRLRRASSACNGSPLTSSRWWTAKARPGWPGARRAFRGEPASQMPCRMSTPPYCAASKTTMIGKPTAARNLDQRRGSVLRRKERARSVTQRSPRLPLALPRRI